MITLEDVARATLDELRELEAIMMFRGLSLLGTDADGQSIDTILNAIEERLYAPRF